MGASGIRPTLGGSRVVVLPCSRASYVLPEKCFWASNLVQHLLWHHRREVLTSARMVRLESTSPVYAI
jgi:hypothetical protein